MELNTQGIGNTAIGVRSLQNNTTGTYNVAIGFGADVNAGAYANAVAIGYGAIASGSNMIQLGNSNIVNVNTSGSVTAGGGLTLNSTTQGFLPPRMTVAQRDAIATPVSGLVVWCNNCGANGELQVFNENASWTNIAGTAAAGVYSPTIGDIYKGGKVAYILAPGDPGYDVNIPHGLIAAISDQSASIKWYNESYITTGAIGTAIGTGLANTNTIITKQAGTSINYAAGLARAYTGGGYNDWYLPSIDELAKLYLNKTAIGGFGSGAYWSSSEKDSNNGWNVDYFGIHYYDKLYTYHVRAIRAF
jgi:hypothetical protein